MLLFPLASIVPTIYYKTLILCSNSVSGSCCPTSAKEMVSQSMKAGWYIVTLLPIMYDIIEWHCDKAQSADIPLKRTSGCEIRI